MNNTSKEYKCICGFITSSLAEFRSHLLHPGKEEPGKHASVDSARRGASKKTSSKKSKKTSSKTAGPNEKLEVTLPGGETVTGFNEVTAEKKLEAKITKPKTEWIEEEKLLEKPSELGEELVEEEDETIKEEPPEETKEQAELKPEIELGLDENDIQSVSADVVGFGLPIRVQLSIKTLALYQIAKSRAKDGLNLGNFLDDCCADYFRGRGVDLGLVELKSD